MALLSFALFLVLSFLGCDGAIFILENRCKNTVWPGIQAGGGHPQIEGGGLELRPGQIAQITAPQGWSGRVWGRGFCSFDQSGLGSCATGDCAGRLKCEGAGGVPPATLAEFTLNSPLDFYDVSLVDGYNIPISIVPSGGSRSDSNLNSCKAVRCVSDLNQQCPGALQVRGQNGTRVVACKSACTAFNEPRYCCTGEFGSPQTCSPSDYSRIFKNACPSAYSYAFDDRSSIFTCQDANYRITFC